MINYIADEYISRLDSFVKDVENAIDESDPLKAERRRLDFKKETSDMRTHLENLNDELGDLVIKFANFAGTPVTLISDEDCMKSPKTLYSEP
jgi:hypothetical protein